MNKAQKDKTLWRATKLHANTREPLLDKVWTENRLISNFIWIILLGEIKEHGSESNRLVQSEKRKRDTEITCIQRDNKDNCIDNSHNQNKITSDATNCLISEESLCAVSEWPTEGWIMIPVAGV